MDWDLTLRAAAQGVIIERITGPPLVAPRTWAGAKTMKRFERGLDEDLRVIDGLLTWQRLPPGVVRDVALAKAWACLWPAYEYYLRGEMRSARRLLFRACTLHSPIMR